MDNKLSTLTKNIKPDNLPKLYSIQLKEMLKVKKIFKINKKSAIKIWTEIGYKNNCTEDSINKAIDELTKKAEVSYTAKQGLYLLKVVKNYDLIPISLHNFHTPKGNLELKEVEFKFQSIADNIKKQPHDGSSKIAVAIHSANTDLGIEMNDHSKKLKPFELYSYSPKYKSVHLVTYQDIASELDDGIKTLQKLVKA